MEAHAIILFDGICNLCNGAVRFIIRHDPKAYFKFAPLQSDYAKKHLAAAGVSYNKMHSLVLIEKEKMYHRSTAVLRITHHLSGGWKICSIFLIIPRFIRDGIYNLIARNRYQWFGKKDQCMLPDPSVTNRFLATKTK